MRVDSKATATSKAYTLAPKLLKCAATYYINKFQENCAIKQGYVQARHNKKPFIATLDAVFQRNKTYKLQKITITLLYLITIKQLIVASKLKRCYFKVLTYCNYANTLGKALNTAKVELAKAKDNLTKLRQLLNNTLKQVAN